MAFEEGIDKLTCGECGTVHEGRWYRMPVREEVKLMCEGCPDVLLHRKMNREYVSLKRIS